MYLVTCLCVCVYTVILVLYKSHCECYCTHIVLGTVRQLLYCTIGSFGVLSAGGVLFPMWII